MHLEKPNTQLTGTAQALLIGSLLGDASLSISSLTAKTVALQESHCWAQKDYCLWKRDLWIQEGFSVSPYTIQKAKKPTHQDVVSFTVHSQRAFFPWWEMFYGQSVKSKNGYLFKRTPNEIVNFITPLALAIWYMDDGCGAARYPSFACHNQANVAAAQAILNSFGIEVDIQLNNKIPKGISITGLEHTKTFINIIKPHIHPCLEYKLHPGSLHGVNCKAEVDAIANVDAKQLKELVEQGNTITDIVRKLEIPRRAVKQKLKLLELDPCLTRAVEADLRHLLQVEKHAGGRRPFTRIPKQVLEELVVSGSSVRNMALRFGVKEKLLKRELERNGLAIPERPNPLPSDMAAHVTSEILWETLLKTRNYKACAKALAISHGTVVQKLKDFGLMDEWQRRPEAVKYRAFLASKGVFVKAPPAKQDETLILENQKEPVL